VLEAGGYNQQYQMVS